MSAAVERVNPPAVALPARIGQATAIEQARAVAEVHAAMLYAQQNPRNESTAIHAIKQSCSQQYLAEKAFYRFSRGGQNVNGETIHLARELARCWRNIDYGIKELSRDDDLGQSEMLAFAWDMEANTRVSNTFIVPHRRDKKIDGVRAPEKLLDLRDIYENNTNNGSRRVRECIFAVLPPYIIEQAKDLCNATIKHGGGIPLPTRIANCVEKFAAIGVTREQLETKQGNRTSGDWTEWDVAQLGIIFKSLEKRETTREEEFAPPKLTVAAVVGRPSGDWPETAQPPAGGEPS